MQNKKTIISHIRETDMVIQLNDDHQSGVAILAEKFASEFGMAQFGRIMGLLHDKGKEQEEWQKYIRGVTGYDKKYSAIKKGPNHSYVGAVIANNHYKELAPLIAQPIAGHHRGLYDYCCYEEEIRRELPKEISDNEIIPIQMPNFPKMEKYDLHHLVRMLFSCLVDADSLDTESFMDPDQAKMRGSHTTMEELLVRLEEHLRKLKENSEDTVVNRVRNYVQDQCVKESQGNSGFYSLTVPTGGGKTLSSVLWALHHAVKNNLHRIIIAIPYTSIIVQTAATLKSIFGEENVLEHHSNVNPEDIKDPELRERMLLATENWDYPIIVTTNVQLFESLFSNKRSSCRKLHNIVKSVIILDEVQTLPLGFYKPIVHTLDTLHRVFGVSILFTTASQPVLEGRIQGRIPNATFSAIPIVSEIIPKEAELHNKLRRTKIVTIKKQLSYNSIAKILMKHDRVLCIVNTRCDAQEIFKALHNEKNCFHLSRMMCPIHIAKTIENIKYILKNTDEPIRVISTQLIEAGVDIDFPIVLRQEAGLDSILQAAGRCNREGYERYLCNTFVFRIKDSSLPSFVSNGCEALNKTKEYYLSQNREVDYFDKEMMREYFKRLHGQRSSFDNKNVENKSIEHKYETVANLFQLVENNQKLIVVNWEDSMDYVNSILNNNKRISYKTIIKLMQYCVSINSYGFNILKSMGALEVFTDNIYILRAKNYYDQNTGLVKTNPWLDEPLIIDNFYKNGK